MYKQNHVEKSTINRNTSMIGETIETMVTRATTNGEKLEGNSSLQYTERHEGVVPAFNVRTDKWDIAIEGNEKIQQIRNTRKEKNESKDDSENQLTVA